MNLLQKLKTVQNDFIANIATITDRPDGWLPHTVFVEEEDENRTGQGTPIYKEYRLIDFKPDGSCTLRDTSTNEDDTQRHLSEINIDWLVTVYQYYCDLSEEQEALNSEPYDNPLEHSLRLLLDVACLEITCFEESETYNQCVKALANSEKKLQSKLSVFLFPVNRFERNATDAEIIADWESDEQHDIPTRKLSPDEFAAECNDEMFADQVHWVRFIKY